MRARLFTAALAIASIAACKSDQDTSSTKVAADNTARNARDQDTAPTADNAGNSSSDVEVTQKIRKAVIEDSSLSTNAHNCKIVVQDGKVTLVGPVASEVERKRVEQIAEAIVGDRNVSNQLEVTN
ncbi:MAG: BON domain-containing protein [Kofleriaceae bacterium]